MVYPPWPERERLQDRVLRAGAAKALRAFVRYRATILVDGLPKSQIQPFGRELRHLHIKVRKVRGVRKEESDALLRLADALAGFVRAALLGRRDMSRLLNRAKRNGYVREI